MVTILFLCSFLLYSLSNSITLVQNNYLGQIETLIHDPTFLHNLHIHHAEMKIMIQKQYFDFSIADSFRSARVFKWYSEQKPDLKLYFPTGNSTALDIEDRQNLSDVLKDLIENGLLPQKSTIIDVGAGYGREIPTLAEFAKVIDTLEPFPQFVEKLQVMKNNNQEAHLRNIFSTPLQNFTFHEKYDVIYVSGVLGIFSDVELIKSLIKFRDALHPDGKIVLIENVVYDMPAYIWDNEKTRNLKSFLFLFSLVGLRPIRLINDQLGLIHTENDFNFPVTIFVLERDVY